MRCLKTTLLAATALCIASVPPVFAKPADRGDTPGLGWGAGGSKGAPGPVAGMGLPFLIAAGAAGAYKLMRRREESHRQHGGEEQGQARPSASA
jgi:hypothetical protein